MSLPLSSARFAKGFVALQCTRERERERAREREKAKDVSMRARVCVCGVRTRQARACVNGEHQQPAARDSLEDPPGDTSAQCCRARSIVCEHAAATYVGYKLSAPYLNDLGSSPALPAEDVLAFRGDRGFTGGGTFFVPATGAAASDADPGSSIFTSKYPPPPPPPLASAANAKTSFFFR